MAIELNAPIEVPAKIYDKLWVSQLTIEAPLGGDAVARFVFTPFSEEHGYMSSGSFVIEVPGILAKIAEGDELIAQAFSAIMQIGQREVNRNDQGTSPTDPDPGVGDGTPE
jgi:hypothetical protein